MARGTEGNKAELMIRVAAAARKTVGKDGAEIGSFIEKYYAHVPPQDILNAEPAALAAAAVGHWRFAEARKPGVAGIRAFTPDAKRDGWTASQSVVEIVNDDMPFLVDSVVAQLNLLAIPVHLVIHPVLTVRRDGKHRLLGLAPKPGEGGAIVESFIQCRIARQPAERLAEIKATLATVLSEVRMAVEDWKPMLAKLDGVIGELVSAPAGQTPDDTAETRAFLAWLRDNHFTFLGYRDYDIDAGRKDADLKIVPRKGLGLLRGTDRMVFNGLRLTATMPKQVRDFIRRPDFLVVTKSNLRSPIHRPVVMDAIAIRKFDASGRVIGLRLFIGLFTSTAYSRSPGDIPLLRRKVREVVRSAGFSPSGHANKALVNILETYPRDELFQISTEDLIQTALGILNLQERQRVALFLRRDDLERFISCMVYIPRESYTTALRLRIQEVLEQSFAGQIASHFAELGESALARLHLLIQTTPGGIPAYDTAAVEKKIIEVARSWSDRLREAISSTGRSEEEADRLVALYAGAFPVAYQERFDAKSALYDIDRLEQTRATDDLSMDHYRPEGMPSSRFRFKLYQSRTEAALSDVLPMLERMGLRVLDEVPFVVRPATGIAGNAVERIMIHDFGLETRDGASVRLRDAAAKFKEVFAGVWRGEIESDGFNALVLKGGLDAREIVILRAYSKYLRQIGLPFSQTYMEDTLAKNPKFARLLVDLFLATFDPAKPAKTRPERTEGIQKQILEGLDAVESADEDRIIRAFLNLVMSSLRTNYFQKAADGGPKTYLSFKLESRKVLDLPVPKPLREIFVYSPRVEGIHLRFGFVARGGLRWSDRREDFRTEVLGLVKAQQVKNAVIVPVGSKGGFFVKQPPASGDRDAYLQEGIACYKTFISGLLDITDTYAGTGTKVVPPKDTVRLDNDDPYLVVAADKGTATFSDIANGVSQAYGFWLGDAFASGGSVGYDHKKMGITAKGAWECVKRHFREIGVDTQAQDFTVVGVGDMSGDVFGNGMLLSPHIKLVGAFNHMHIFLDPDPDPVASLKERQRMFNLPRSGWNDYDAKLISKGGGIYPRSAKSIPITPEVRARFGIAQQSLSPNELIRVLLKAHVDLLWFGGIGSYIKSSIESNADAGDRANDALRINGAEVCAKVIGEGANLGVTQRGRIEAALAGVQLNQDSIDNSAGVDCSDHEVNIKILLDAVVAGGDLNMKGRNALLAKMTDEVGGLCLRDNYLQSQAISVSQHQGVGFLDRHVRLIKMLERAGELDRAVEFLPDDEAIVERAQSGKGLTRPEIGVLLSYSKNWLYAELLKSDYPDDEALDSDLVGYFPETLGKKYPEALRRHRLRREIVATVATNLLVNRVGETFVTGLMERTGMAPDQIVRAFTIARRVFALDDLWAAIEALDNKVPAHLQAQMLIEIDVLLDWVTLWFLRNGRAGLDIGSHTARYKAGIAALADGLSDILPAHYVEDRKSRAQPYIDQGVPEKLAIRIAGVVNMFSGCDIVSLAEKRKVPVATVAKAYFAVGTRFRLGHLRAAAEKLDSRSHWQKLAIAALIEETYGHQLTFASQVLDAAKPGTPPAKAIEAWIEKKKMLVEQTDRLLADLWSTAISDLSMVAVASRQLRALAASVPS